MYCCALELNGIQSMLKVWMLKVKPIISLHPSAATAIKIFKSLRQ
jgi:hypothetical protein